MMRTTYCFFFLWILMFLIPVATVAQTANFDETWKEFLENDKISNMSALIRPDKVSDEPNYAKYLLMNTNTSFCQSEMAEAETLMTEVQDIDTDVLESIPGFLGKMEDLKTKMEAYHTVDGIWKRFLSTKEVPLKELEAVTAAKTVCEKQTLAKYSYMTAHSSLCQGEVTKSKNIFENRTLKLAEKTSLRVEDVEGLPGEVAKMKSFFQALPPLEVAWDAYVKTGVSPGFEKELPLFPCYPIPNMKVLVLKGVADVCDSGPAMLEEIRKLQTVSGVAPDRTLAEKVKELEAAIKQKEADLAALKAAWEAFIPDNKVKNFDYGYDYCSKEPLIRAYIMDGFSYVCGLAEEMLEKIDSLQRPEITELEEITMIKIGELAASFEQYQFNGVKIERLWNKFIAQGDTLFEAYPTTDVYCDNIQQVKDWTINGFCGTCEEANQYLEQIEAFQETFEFSFTQELECRVQNLRVRVWDCRYQALQELAHLDGSSAPYEDKLEALMDEYGMGPRPEVCKPRK